MFYKDSPNGDGTHFTLNCNFDSSARAPEFLDGYRELFPTSIDEDTYLIVDVRTISIEKQKQNVSYECFHFNLLLIASF